LMRTWLLILTNLNSLHQRIIFTQFDWIWPAGSGEDFKNNSVYFYSFAIISPSRGLNPPQGWFVPSLVKIGPVFLEKKSKM
jgi:hypothetical protein